MKHFNYCLQHQLIPHALHFFPLLQAIMKHVWFHSVLFSPFSPRNLALLSHYTMWNKITPKSLVSFSKYYNNNKYHTSSHFNRSHCNKCSTFSVFSTFSHSQQSMFKHSYTILRRYSIFCHLSLKQVFNWWLTQSQMETCPLKIWLIHLMQWSTICNLILQNILSNMLPFRFLETSPPNTDKHWLIQI